MRVRSVVVTGASTGIGRATVAELVPSGFHLGHRSPQRGRDRLAEEFGEGVTPCWSTSKTTSQSGLPGQRVCAADRCSVWSTTLERPCRGLGVLPIAVFRRQLRDQSGGSVADDPGDAAGPLRVGERFGAARIVMVGSIGGRIAGPILGPYHASKHGLVGMTGPCEPSLRRHTSRCAGRAGRDCHPIWRAARRRRQILDGHPAADAAVRGAAERAARAMARRGATSRVTARRSGPDHRWTP